jgi:hypothetical protein
MHFPRMLVAIVGLGQCKFRAAEIRSINAPLERGQTDVWVQDNPEYGCGETPRTGTFYPRRFEIFPIPVRSRMWKLREGIPNRPRTAMGYIASPVRLAKSRRNSVNA